MHPHSKLSDRLEEVVQLCFIKKKMEQRSYVDTKSLSLKFIKTLTETDIIKMLEFFLFTSYLLYLEDVFSTDSRHPYGEKPSSSSYYFICTNSYKGFIRKKKWTLPDPLQSRSVV